MPSIEDRDRLSPPAAQGLAKHAYLSLVSRSLADTALFADALANVLLPGDVVLLVGDLGTGKTAFTKALARSLGIYEPITSPTFTIMRTYEGYRPGCPSKSVTLAHIDAYRLEHADAIEDLGLFELLDRGAVAVIEWGDLVAEAFGTAPLVIRFSTNVDVCAADVDVDVDVRAVDVGVRNVVASDLVVVEVDAESESDLTVSQVSHLVKLGEGYGDEFVDNEPRLILCNAHPDGRWHTRLVALHAGVASLVLSDPIPAKNLPNTQETKI